MKKKIYGDGTKILKKIRDGTGPGPKLRGTTRDGDRKFNLRPGTEGTGTQNPRDEKGPGPEFDTGTRPRRSLHRTPFKNIGEKKL